MYKTYFKRWARHQKPRIGLAVPFAMTAIGIAPLIILAAHHYGITIPAPLSWAIAIACVSVGVPTLRAMRCVALRIHSDAIVCFGHCPTCGYELRSLPLDPDGCVTCPECGAAWKPRWEPHVA